MAHIPEKSATKSDLTLLKILKKYAKKRVFGQDKNNKRNCSIN